MNVNVTKIQRLSNGIIQFYNGSDIVDSFSVTSSVSIGFESNLAKTIIFSSSVKTLSFNVFNIIALYGSASNKIYSAGIDPSDTSSAYVNRLYDIYGFLISDVIQGCCPGPTFVGGVVASYPNFASFPATGQQSVIYIDESTNQAYYWDGTSYQLLTSTGVETYPNFASFPVTGMANIIYVDLSVPESYVWNGSVYVSLDGGSVAWGSIIGTLSAQTDLQTALNAKQATLVSGTNIKTVNSTSLLGAGDVSVGTVTSVGLTMPSAFNVASSPITTSGTLAVTGAGVVSQYVRGDGSLANFPSSTGGGSSVAFYLNGSVAQGTFGGVAMKEMDRVPVLGAGTDFTIATNGYIQSFITDANVPNLLEIPAGNWNFETYFSASSSGGSPSFYVELYKWDGATLSLIASNSATPEGITNGTATDLYFSAIAVPQTTLALTDRLAVRIYVNNSGRTIKLHTENSHLCEVITTFSTGLTALNGLTAQVQNFATGTSGTDFGISSATSTHTFNLPTASAANRGALSSADWTTFNSKVPATRTLTINGTTQDLSADRTFTIATGLTVGTTPITSGTIGRVLFEGTGNVLQQSGSLFWDNTNGRLGIGGTPSTFTLDVNGTARVSGNTTIVGTFSGTNSNARVAVNNTTATPNTGFSLLANNVLKWSLASYGATSDFTFYNDALSLDALFIKGSTNNVIIGGTTDAGYKFDVNGTARVQGNTTITGFLSLNSFLTLTPAINGNVIQGTQTIEYRSGGSSASRNYHWFTNANAFTSTVEDMYHVLMRATFSPTSGTAGYNQLTLYPLINQTGGANGVTRGLLIQPTLTAAANWRAIEISSGGVYVNTTNVAASSILQADSTTQGFLPPRMTTTQKNAISSPATGLVVYDSTLNALNFYNGSSWTSGSSGGTVTAVTATAPMSSTGGATPDLSMTSANGTTNGYLLSSDWLIFNGKFNTPTGTTLQYLRGDGSVATFPVIPAQYNPTAGTGISITGTYPNQTITNTAPDQLVALTAGSGIGVAGTYPNFTISNSDPTSGVTLSSAGGTESLVNDGTGPSLATKGLTAGTGISLSGAATAVTVTNSAPDQVVAIAAGTGIGVTGTYPNFTVTNSAPSSGGTVTSVAALTLGTTGTDLTSTVATGTTTPVITLNVPTASAANRGALSSADWTTFNNKQNALGFTAVPTTRTISTTAPLSGGGDLSADRTLSMAAATTSVNGYLTSTDWTTFNNKQAALVSGTNIKTVNGTTLLGSGDLVIPVFQLQGTNFLSVLANGTPAQNGQAVRDAYTAAQAMTPNGAAKSATNRVVILLAPGYYTFSEATLGAFTINQSFIDFESLSGMTDVYFSSVQVISPFPGINVRISGINTTKNNYYTHGAFAVASTGDSSENIYIKDCVGGDYSFSAFSSAFIGTIENCSALNFSFLYKTTAATPAGITSGGGGINLALYGTFKNCTASEYSFLYSDTAGTVENYGTIDNCTSGFSSFLYGTAVSNNGTISNCIGTNHYSFLVGGDAINNGLIVNCRGRNFSFIVTFNLTGVAENYGRILNCDCTSIDACFVSNVAAFYTGTNYGRISNCTAYNSIGAFCGNLGSNNGFISNCIVSSKAFCCDNPSGINEDILRCTMTADTFTVGATGGGRVVLGIDNTGVVNY